MKLDYFMNHLFLFKLLTYSICFCFAFAIVSLGLGLFIGLILSIPLVITLNNILKGVEFSYFPMAAGLLALSFSVLVLHSILYFLMVATGETLKERESKSRGSGYKFM